MEKTNALVPTTGNQKAVASPRNTPKWDNAAKARLSNCLGHVCVVQRQYGKQATDLETIVDGFAWALSDYKIEDVIRAIGKFIAMHPDIPTPSDIRKIIDPVKEPWTPDWSFYNSLKKLVSDQGPYSISDEEREYIRACEEFSLRRLRESY